MNVCNEAALIAVRNNSSVVDMEHFDAAVERVVAGGLVVRFSLAGGGRWVSRKVFSSGWWQVA